jgi:HPt (histidine-containing phosphotransfer) domain-containing protein
MLFGIRDPCVPGGVAVAQVAIQTDDRAANVAPVIDRSYLQRMTYGDSSLERELLQLFARQIEILVARMRASDAAAIATLAHTLKGSACGVGAVSMAQAAEAAERTAAQSPAGLAAALDTLEKVGEETRALIANILRAH